MPLGSPSFTSQNTVPTEPPVPSRGGTSPIGTSNPNTGATAATNSSYQIGAFASGINPQGAATAYTLQNTDYQGIIEFNGSSAITVTLNGAVGTNFTCTILNIGTGAITLSPDSGYLVNGSASITLGSGVGAQVFFAARSWTAFSGATFIPVVPTNTPAVLHQWLKSYNSTTGAFTQTQPAYSDLSGSPSAAVIPINAQTVSYVALVGDLGTIIQMNAAGATTVTLPVTFATGFSLWVKDVGAGTCTVSASSGNIDSHASIAITTGQAYQFYWDGSLWRQLSQSLSA